MGSLAPTIRHQPNQTKMVCLMICLCSFWGGFASAQPVVNNTVLELDKTILELVRGAKQLEESRQHLILSSLGSSDSEEKNKGLAAVVMYLRNAKDGQGKRLFQEKVSVAVSAIVNQKKKSSYALGAVAVIAEVNGLLGNDDTKKAFSDLLASDNKSVETYLSMLPYVPWTVTKTEGLWGASQNQSLFNHLRQLFERENLRTSILDSCTAAIELGTCDLQNLLDLFDELVVSPDLRQADFKRMLLTIRIGYLMRQAFNKPEVPSNKKKVLGAKKQID